MTRRMALVLTCLALALGSTACAPQLVGPTPGAGYRFSLEVSDPTIWMGQGPFPSNASFPQAATLVVRVQDAQGRPVDGVPVTFEVEPDWARSIALAPSQTTTRGGIARAVVYAPQTTGVVHIMARVDTMTAQTRLTVQRYAAGGNAASSQP
jgi:hypothetical protein